MRALTVLVETSDAKKPPTSTLGSTSGVYSPGGSGDGHVPRNMRLALAVIDLVQPFVNATRSDAATAVEAGACVPLRWSVWGALAVDDAAPFWRNAGAQEWTRCAGPTAGARAFPTGGLGVWGGASTPLAPHEFTGCAQLPAENLRKLEAP